MHTMFRLQPLDPQTDFPRLAELRNAVDPEPISAEQLQEWEAERPQGQMLRRMVAVDAHGQIIGFNDAGRKLPRSLHDTSV